VSAVTKIIQIKCPKCNTPIFYKYVDSVFLCENCGTMHIRDAGIETIDIRAGKFTRPAEGERVYFPYWILNVSFNIDDIQTEGGGLSNLFGLLGGQSRQGTFVMYIPAYETEAMAFKETAMQMTASPPNYEAGKLENGVKRYPVTLTSDQLLHIAEFLFVTGVAEKPGVLQRLSYRLNVSGKALLYLPYYKKGESYQPGY
jgi:hypothetical protein